MLVDHDIIKSAFPHGGSRNSGKRVSVSLKESLCEQIIQASWCAYYQHCEFNRFITIHWQKCGLTDCEAAQATGQFIKYCSDWMSHHRYKLAWTWVRENDGKIGRIGSHVHILLHVPIELGPLFGRFPLRWVKLIGNRKVIKGVVKTKIIYGYKSIKYFPEIYCVNLFRCVGYILKAASEGTAIRLNIPRYGRFGEVIGKRGAVCQMLLRNIRLNPNLYDNILPCPPSNRLQRNF